ncbi:MAG: REDY-like protein HapK [Thermoleophilia bacterium]|nr:REDY-like protein HapK [Thermoleophilia bacterium]
MKCFVTFRLKPGVTPEQYEEWFRTENVPAVRRMRSLSSYRVWRATGAMEGEPPYEYLEEMEFDDQAAFDREVETLPEMAAMLEGWLERVAENAIVYAVEVGQEAR